SEAHLLLETFGPDIFSIMHTLPMDLSHRLVGPVNSPFQGITQGAQAEDTTAVHNPSTVFPGRARMKDFDVGKSGGCLDPLDDRPFFGSARITLGGQDHADTGALLPE